MTANIRGISAAIRNANDGISMTQTAEGSLAAIGDNLQRIRELTVQSANSTNTVSDRAALNAEAAQLVAEIDRVANNTTFNGIKLLDGSYQNQSLQVGAGNDSNDRINISIGSAKSTSLGIGSGSTFSATSTSVAVGATALLGGALSINGFAVGAASNDGLSSTTPSASGIAVANAINAITSSTNVTATANATTLAGTAATTFASLAANDIKINGVDIGALDAAVSVGARAGQMAAAINAKTSQTGVTATFTTLGAVSLAAIDGRNITIEKSVNAGANDANTGITTSIAAVTAGTLTVRGTVTLNSTDSKGITVAGATAASLTAAGLANLVTAPTTTVGAGVSSLDLKTVAGSQAALTILDSAINTITDSRAAMGAYQNRLAASISNLETTSMNLSASRSRILDTDYAKETTNLAKSQIITQAATAMLAQANQSSQSVLALLK
jgi:flagellin